MFKKLVKAIELMYVNQIMKKFGTHLHELDNIMSKQWNKLGEGEELEKVNEFIKLHKSYDLPAYKKMLSSIPINLNIYQLFAFYINTIEFGINPNSLTSLYRGINMILHYKEGE